MSAVLVVAATVLMAISAFSLAWLRDRHAVQRQRRRIDRLDD